jgi:DNA-binding LacI/PurR family transcriptional regulator
LNWAAALPDTLSCSARLDCSMANAKPTSRDIAHSAGVSQATVSRALRNSPLVRAETRQRVLEVARELNYCVNWNAATLRTHESRTLALLLFDEPTSDDCKISPFFLSMLGNITRAAALRDYDVLVSSQQLRSDWHVRYEVSSRADGLILLGYGDYVSYHEKLEALAKAHAHFMIWGPIVEDQPGCSVGCDNRRGSYEATAHLIHRGRRNIAFLGEASEHAPEFKLRYDGYTDALSDAKLAVSSALRVDADNQESSGFAAIQRLLDHGAVFDGVVAASDLIAIGAIRALQARGRHVPEHVSVVGFDDIPVASYVSPALTTVRQNTHRAADTLVTNLIKLIHGEAVESTLLPPELIVRESCGTHTRAVAAAALQRKPARTKRAR